MDVQEEIVPVLVLRDGRKGLIVDVFFHVLPREILLWECHNRAHEHHSGQVKKARCENGTWAEREIFFYRTGARLPCCRVIAGHVRATEHCVLRR